MKKMSKLDKQVKVNRKKSMTKKALDEYNKAQRTSVSWNTGTRVHASVKDYNRQATKQAIRKAMREAC